MTAAQISSPRLKREEILPEGRLEGRAALARGAARAKHTQLGPSAFLAARGVRSELDFKRQCIAQRKLTFHAQIGYRSIDDSRRAWADIHDRLAPLGWAPDRYGICLDWSMGYPKAARAAGRRGTGLILEREEDYVALTAMAPVAPHFGDFVLGMPAAVETVSAALLAGATAIGNLSQYFTFRLPGWDDDVATTLATVEALGLLKAQSAQILVHSNLDDGYAAWFTDMGCALGFAMIEKWIIEDLIGLPLGHCFGHTFTDPVKRLAFKTALAAANSTPGTMIYGNTTIYGAELAANYGALASYLVIDMMGQLDGPTGHAMTPIPVTEAQRIPSIDEIVEAHMAARRLAERMPEIMPLMSLGASTDTSSALTRRGSAFRARVLDALSDGGIDMDDPAEILLALRRLGPERLEQWYAGGDTGVPAVASAFVDEIETLANEAISRLDTAAQQKLTAKRPRIVVAATDVHFYGKRLIDTIIRRLAVEPVDGGVSIEPAKLAKICSDARADAVAVSTYNGIALTFIQSLRSELSSRNCPARIYVGGRLNEILDDTQSSLPSNVAAELRQLGAKPCLTAGEFLTDLAAHLDRERP